MSAGHASDWWRPTSVCNLTRMLAVDKLVYMDAPPEEWPRRIALNASSTCNLRHNYVISHRALALTRTGRVDTYCWNYLRRYTRDFRSEWECALDMFFHQCVPGPLDASADVWIATLWRLSTEHRRPRAW